MALPVSLFLETRVRCSRSTRHGAARPAAPGATLQACDVAKGVAELKPMTTTRRGSEKMQDTNEEEIQLDKEIQATKGTLGHCRPASIKFCEYRPHS